MNMSVFPEEVRLVHEVYSAAQQYGNFLDHGWPISYDVPKYPGTVISGLSVGDKVWGRRTDFGNNKLPVKYSLVPDLSMLIACLVYAS